MQKTEQSQDIQPASSRRLTKYGLFYIRESSSRYSSTSETEEFENGAAEREASDRWTEHQSEMQLLEQTI